MNRLAVICILATGCYSHIASYEPKTRKYQQGDYESVEGGSAGSLYRPTVGGLFEDNRARGVGDIIVIAIDESETATRDSATQLSKKSSLNAGLSSAFGLIAAGGSVTPAEASLGASTNNAFDGSGKISRAGSLHGTLPVRVRKVMPNGDFYVEGQKVVLVNDEENHLYISGVIRPADISPDNIVPSSRVADAEIEYTGRGVVTETNRQGWLAKVVNFLWPF